MKALSDCRVLVVDDARTNVDILVEALKHDYKVSVALNGDMALKSAARTPPDLVLLDIMMPGMDGYEVCRRMRAMPEMADVPIVFLSALDEARNKAQGFEAGANDYVTKPFETLEVQARVRYLLKAKAYSDSVKEQLAADLRVAHEIQMGMIPQEFSALESAFGVELASVLEPAREVGGDLFGVFADRDRLVLVMGDVSGKGIPASLFMVRTCTLVRLLARQIQEPERILQALNDELSADNPSGMFVTLICAVFEPLSGRVTLANGGQTPPVWLRAGEKPRWAVPALGTALGLEPDMPFQRVELTLEPGDSLVFYTDGVTEAFNPQDDCYGNDRLLALMAEAGPQEAAALAARVLKDVRIYANGAPQSDDIAVLAVRVVKLSGVPPPEHLQNAATKEPSSERRLQAAGAPAHPPVAGPTVTLELQASPEEVMRGVGSLESFCQEHQVPQTLVFGVMLALEEMSSNVVNHAYGQDASQKFRVTFRHLGDRLVIELRDQGPAFNPLTVPIPVADPDDEEMREGGVGIYLTHHYLDDLNYHREGNENVLLMTKLLAAASGKPDAALT